MKVCWSCPLVDYSVEDFPQEDKKRNQMVLLFQDEQHFLLLLFTFFFLFWWNKTWQLLFHRSICATYRITQWHGLVTSSVNTLNISQLVDFNCCFHRPCIYSVFLRVTSLSRVGLVSVAFNTVIVVDVNLKVYTNLLSNFRSYVICFFECAKASVA